MESSEIVEDERNIAEFKSVNNSIIHSNSIESIIDELPFDNIDGNDSNEGEDDLFNSAVIYNENYMIEPLETLEVLQPMKNVTSFDNLILSLPDTWKLEYDKIVWSKDGSFPWWPSQIMDPNFVPQNIKDLMISHKYIGIRHVVSYFGTKDYGFIKPECIQDYRALKDKHMKQKLGKKYQKDFQKAIVDAENSILGQSPIQSSSSDSNDDESISMDLTAIEMKSKSKKSPVKRSNITKRKEKKQRKEKKRTKIGDEEEDDDNDGDGDAMELQNYADEEEDEATIDTEFDISSDSDNNDHKKPKKRLQKQSQSSKRDDLDTDVNGNNNDNHIYTERPVSKKARLNKASSANPTKQSSSSSSSSSSSISTSLTKSMRELISDLTTYTSKESYNQSLALQAIYELQKFKPTIEEILSNNAVIVNDLRRSDDIKIAAAAKTLRNLWKKCCEEREFMEQTSNQSIERTIAKSPKKSRSSIPPRQFKVISGSVPVRGVPIKSDKPSTSIAPSLSPRSLLPSSSSSSSLALTENPSNEKNSSNPSSSSNPKPIIQSSEHIIPEEFSLDKLPEEIRGNQVRSRSIRLLHSTSFKNTLVAAIRLESKLYEWIGDTNSNSYRQNIIKLAFALQKPSLKKIKDHIVNMNGNPNFDMIFSSSIINLARL